MQYRSTTGAVHVAGLAILFAVAAPAFAVGQESTGTLQGLVKDSSGAVVPDAVVTLRDAETTVTRNAPSGPDGAFVFALVRPAVYQLTVVRDGFRTATIDDLLVRLGEAMHVVVALEVGSVQETVTVAVEALRAVRSGGSVEPPVSTRFIRDMPNFTRNTLDTVNLAPGVDLLPGGQSGTGQLIGVDGGTIIANGHRRSQNSYYLDGAENAGAWRNSALQFPNPDTIEAVDVETANAGAQFGKQPGSVVSVLTRSGSNVFRGTAFHFFHDERLNAGRWADNRAGLPKPEDNQRYAGAVFGGPIWRNRTFLFASFNAFRTNDPATQQAGRFPTQAMKDGDFSAVPDFVRPNGTVVQFDIKDPTTGASLGKTVPRSMMDPAALRIADLLPTAVNYYDTAIRQYDRPVRNDEYLLKVDHVVGADQQVSGLLLTTRGLETDPGQAFGNNTTPEWGALERYGHQLTTIVKHRWIPTPSLSVESRFSLAGSSSDINPSDRRRDVHDLGIAFPFTAPIKRLPGILLDSSGGFRANFVNADCNEYKIHVSGRIAVQTRTKWLGHSRAAIEDIRRRLRDRTTLQRGRPTARQHIVTKRRIAPHVARVRRQLQIAPTHGRSVTARRIPVRTELKR
jgi:hypothetical protein